VVEEIGKFMKRRKNLPLQERAAVSERLALSTCEGL
jgi:hypothetical protein